MADNDLHAFDATVRLQIVQGFLAGETPTVASIAPRLRASHLEVAASFDRLAAGRAIVLAPGSHDIAMAAPFAGAPSDFRVTVGPRRYYANCIWDALGVPAMLGGVDAEIETRCGDCGEWLHVTIRDGVVDGGSHVVHFAVPAARWWADIVFT